MKNQLREVPKFENIKEIIYNSVKLYPENIAFTIKEKKEGDKIEYKNVTYTQLLKDINALGTVLYEKRLQGKRIAIIGKNQYHWAISHLACLLGGIVSVPLDKDLQINELEESLIRSKVDAIIFDEKLTDKIQVIKENLNPRLSYLSFSILFCSSSSKLIALYCSVLANSSSFLYFPIFGAIIFSITNVPIIEIIIEVAIIKNKLEVREICIVSSTNQAAVLV